MISNNLTILVKHKLNPIRGLSLSQLLLYVSQIFLLTENIKFGILTRDIQQHTCYVSRNSEGWKSEEIYRQLHTYIHT